MLGPQHFSASSCGDRVRPPGSRNGPLETPPASVNIRSTSSALSKLPAAIRKEEITQWRSSPAQSATSTTTRIRTSDSAAPTAVVPPTSTTAVPPALSSTLSAPPSTAAPSRLPPCWNCFSTAHDTAHCPDEHRSNFRRELLREQLNLPIPDDRYLLEVWLGAVCHNCWQCTTHIGKKCPQRQRTVREKEALRVKLGFPLSRYWRGFAAGYGVVCQEDRCGVVYRGPEGIVVSCSNPGGEGARLEARIGPVLVQAMKETAEPGSEDGRGGLSRHHAAVGGASKISERRGDLLGITGSASMSKGERQNQQQYHQKRYQEVSRKVISPGASMLEQPGNVGTLGNRLGMATQPLKLDSRDQPSKQLHQPHYTPAQQLAHLRHISSMPTPYGHAQPGRVVGSVISASMCARKSGTAGPKPPKRQGEQQARSHQAPFAPAPRLPAQRNLGGTGRRMFLGGSGVPLVTPNTRASTGQQSQHVTKNTAPQPPRVPRPPPQILISEPSMPAVSSPAVASGTAQRFGQHPLQPQPQGQDYQQRSSEGQEHPLPTATPQPQLPDSFMSRFANEEAEAILSALQRCNELEIRNALASERLTAALGILSEELLSRPLSPEDLRSVLGSLERFCVELPSIRGEDIVGRLFEETDVASMPATTNFIPDIARRQISELQRDNRSLRKSLYAERMTRKADTERLARYEAELEELTRRLGNDNKDGDLKKSGGDV